MAERHLAQEPSPIRGISRNVFLLGLVSFFTDLASEMVYPLIPLFVTATLGAPVGAVGVIEGVAETTAALFKGLSGWLSDRLGVRKPLILGGYGLAAITKPLLALAASWPMVLATRVIDRFAKGMRGSARDALIADSSTPETRGRAFGFHRSFDQMGAVLGPLLALPVLGWMNGDFRAVFVLALVPGVLSTLTVLFIRDSRRSLPAAPVPARVGGSSGPISPVLRVFLAITLLFALGNSSDAFLILRARDLGMPPAAVVLLFTLFNFTYVLAAYPAGRLSDRIPRRWMIASGYAVFAVVYGGVGLAPGAGWLWPLFALYGIYMGLAEGVARAYVVDLAGSDARGTALGIHATAIGLGALPASLIAGALWEWWSPSAPFLFGAATAALAAVLLIATQPRSAVR